MMFFFFYGCVVPLFCLLCQGAGENGVVCVRGNRARESERESRCFDACGCHAMPCHAMMWVVVDISSV